MKVLYVSDLDGTLLNLNAKLDSVAVEELNNLIEMALTLQLQQDEAILYVKF